MTDTDTDTNTDTMPEPGTIEEARFLAHLDLVECMLSGSGLKALARLALAEHERAEALARRVAELEAELSDLRPLAVGRRLPGEAVGRCAETVCAREDELEAANADD